MMAQQPQKLDPQQVQNILTELKRRMSQAEGEMTTMREDAKSMLFNNVAQILNQAFTEIAKGQKAEATLEEIYNGHPEIKIAMDKKAKEADEKAKSKIVEKGK